MKPGCLILVAGPSGAGKDTLIAAAKQHFADQPQFAFPRRVVTREAQADAEDHFTVKTDDFMLLSKSGGFALSWQAHGLHYGIPASIIAEMAAGRHVVINASRGIVASAMAQFARLAVIEVTAPADVLLQRLAARRREADGDLRNRVLREAEPYPEGVRLVSIRNDGSRERAETAFIKALQDLTR